MIHYYAFCLTASYGCATVGVMIYQVAICQCGFVCSNVDIWVIHRKTCDAFIKDQERRMKAVCEHQRLEELERREIR